MSLNVPERIMRLTKDWKVSVDIEVSKLGKLQLSGLKKMLTTGVIKERGVPATIAKKMREAHGLPTIHITGDSVDWKRLPGDCAFYEKLTVALVQHKLTVKPEQSGRNYYGSPDINGAMVQAEKKEAEGGVWVPGLNKAHFQKLKLGSNETLDTFVAKLTAGEITSIPFIYS